MIKNINAQNVEGVKVVSYKELPEGAKNAMSIVAGADYFVYTDLFTEEPVSYTHLMFLGEYSSEPLGDYFAGPNHVLPTNGTAKFFSPLSVDDFIKKSSIISFSRDCLLYTSRCV